MLPLLHSIVALFNHLVGASEQHGDILKGNKPADLPVQQITKNRNRHQLEAGALSAILAELPDMPTSGGAAVLGSTAAGALALIRRS
jgi:hypothetical protein